MLIGIDASRAFVSEPTGTETYSYQVISHILQLPAAKRHNFVLFIRPGAVVPEEISRHSNVVTKLVRWPYLWTQAGLALETWGKFQIPSTKLQATLDLLWVPAHTLPVLRNPRVITVVTIHGLEYKWLPEYHNWLQRWYLPLSTYYAARAAERVIAVSQATKRDLLLEIQIDPEKVSVIGEGVGRIQNAMERHGRQKGEYVLFVGTIQPRKNLVNLIRAFARFSRQLPQYKLVIAGAVGWQAAAVLREPARVGVTERVVFTGRVSQAELSALYQGAQIYVQPSWTEGFGLPVLEAMAHGVPVIVSDGGALPEVVGAAGVVVNLKHQVPNSKQIQNSNNQTSTDFVERLAGAMEQIARDHKLRARLVKSGRERVRGFTWHQTAQQTLVVLEKALY